VNTITSRSGSLVAACRAVARGDDRTRILLDGPHLVGEALAAGVVIDQVFVAAADVDRPDIGPLLDRLEAAHVAVARAASSVMAAVSPVRSASPLVAIAQRPDTSETRLFAAHPPLLVVACDVQDPGNVGALVRVSEAAGASGFVSAGRSADPFGWKALRGSMGSALRLPIAVSQGIDDATAAARRRKCRLVAAVPRDGEPIFDADLRGPLALLIGGEGAGLPQAVVETAHLRVTIPMTPPVESLNTAVAAALVLYEARRQRL
jgi:TrmH family RNA methyltransferase